MRYIDADTAKINLSALKKYNNSHGIILAADEDAISEWIDKQPTADVRENVKGEWLHISDGYCDFLKCSQCGKTTDSQSNFCPNCGCLMKGEEE